MNRVDIVKRRYRYEIEGIERWQEQAEFVIDGHDLCIRLGIEGCRPWFGATRFEWNEELRRSEMLALQGLKESRNQFGSGRMVLYGCHCGCDYCGVISCTVERENGMVFWRDIRQEPGGFLMSEELGIAEFAFEDNQLDQAIRDFFK